MRKILSLTVLLIMAITANASITSDGTAKIYLNAGAVSWWTNANAVQKVVLSGESSATATVTGNYLGNQIYEFTLPNGTWNTGVFGRYQQETSENPWNKTGAIDLTVTDGKNCIMTFAENSSTVTWGVLPSTTETATYTVVGTENLTGYTWKPDEASNDMTLQDGIYYWKKQNVTLTNNNVEFKIAKNHGWNTAYPNSNYKLDYLIPSTGGTFDFTISFNPSNTTITANVTRTVNIGSALYATYAFSGYTDYADSRTNLTAYTVKVENSRAKLYPISGTVPPVTPVVIKGNEAKNYDVYAYAYTTSTADVSNNDLKLSDGSVKGDGSTIYVLGNKSKGVGFYLATADNTVPAGRCYLVIPASSGAKDFISFDEETTAINNFKAETVESSAIYNLQGIQVDENYKGIVVKNGKKFINK